jgi:hypothetical protein
MARRKSRSYCFTINNYEDSEYEAIRDCGQLPSTRYLVCGKEIGDSGTRHLQGYVYFSNPRTLSGVKRLPGFARSHLEVSRGTPLQASDYCKKDGDFFETGELPSSGKRTDLDEIKQEISDGKSDLYIADNHFSQWVVYRRSFAAYRRLLVSTPRNFKSWTNVLVGSTGLGKTRFVYQQHQDDDIFVWGGDRWFDGYVGQRIALLDDYRGELSIGFLLRLLDRYPLQVPIKGGFVNWNPRRIYITSNTMPEVWYADVDGASVAALLRRIDRLDSISEPIFE